MAKSVKEKIGIEELERDVENLKKKIFIYEALQAEKEIKEGKVKGPFRTGKEVLEYIKI